MSKTSNKTKILAVIPARSGSKRIPQKNIRMLGDRPLISYIMESAMKSKLIDRLILSTDSDDMADIALSMGVEIPFKRPVELSSDNSTLVSVVNHAYEYYKDKGVKYDAVISLQPTCPFTKPETIDEMISLWRRTGCDSVTTIAEITQGHPYIAKGLEKHNSIRDFCPVPEYVAAVPRRKWEKAYYLTGGVYLRSRKLLEKDIISGHCLGNDARAVIVSEVEAVDINTELDFRFADFLIKERIVKA